MSWLTALGLCIAGLAAIIIEFFVPAAGLIGILGFASIVGGVVIAYTQYGTMIGSIFLIGVAITTPLVMLAYFKLFPKSFVGRWLILGRSHVSGDEKIVEKFSELLGKRGTAQSALRPSGTAVIDGRKYSVVTGGEFIDAGETVEVTRVEGNRVRVRTGGSD